jgi:hypothetical protein
MSQAYSISTHRCFGLSRVCGVWGVPRATVYRHRAVANGEDAANTGQPPLRALEADQKAALEAVWEQIFAL